MFQTLSEFQDWVGENWLYPLHTQAAEHHLRAKLREEVAELIEALKSGTPHDIAQEAGDVLWICGALCLNAYTSIETAVAKSTIGCGLGRVPRLPEVDWLFHGFYIRWDAPMVQVIQEQSAEEITRLMEQAEPDILKAVIAELAHQVSMSSHMTKIANEKGYHDAYWDLDRARLNEGVAQILLAVSIVAQLEAGLTLSEICELTQAKHQRRLAAGQPVTHPPTRPH